MQAGAPGFIIAVALAATTLAGTGRSATAPAKAAPAGPHEEAPAAGTPSTPWRLGKALKLPSWLHLEATHRIRFEHLRNQFRPLRPGNDSALSLRTTLLAEFRLPPVTLGVELMDSRIYLTDDNTPLDTSLVNPFDLLQAFVEANLDDVLADGDRLRLRAGRQTMDLGGRRLLARNRFRNTINAFSGLDLEWTGAGLDCVRVFLTMPVERRVASARGNEVRLDLERTEAVFWGVFFGSRPRSDGVRAEMYALGLHEHDSDDYPTRNRRLVTPGVRVYRSLRTGQTGFELEAALQAGSSRFTILPEDTTDLSHLAFFVHAAVARSFSGAWEPRLVLMYDYASGDRDPSDDAHGRFDTLFGARRFEFGPTGIYGAFARSNISSPGIRLEARPHQAVTGFVAYRPAWLASARDLWTTTLIWDPEGRSGSFLGHQLEACARFELLPGNVWLEAGLARLWLGGFPRDAPNGTPDARDPTYIYTQVGFRI